MERTIKKRTAAKDVVRGLIVRAKGAIQDESKVKDVQTYLKTIDTKLAAIEKWNDEILNEVEDGAIATEMEESTNFEVSVMKEVDQIKQTVNSYTVKSPKKEVHEDKNEDKLNVKLRKLIIKKFYGDPIFWEQFIDTFEAAIGNNNTISNIQKFTYLRGYLGGEAEKCIDGMSLTNANYVQALNLLKERYGNKQLVISSHMDDLVRLERLSSSRVNVSEVRKLYDKIEGHLRSLVALGKNSDEFGDVLIPVILDKLPNDIRLEISRKLGQDNWEINVFMKLLSDEIMARENCEYVKGGNSNSGGKV